MRILIGPENVADALKETSVVMASYDIGDGMRGVIGVVGTHPDGLCQNYRPPGLLCPGAPPVFSTTGELPEAPGGDKDTDQTKTGGNAL